MRVYVEDSHKTVDQIAIRLGSVNTNLLHIWKPLDPMYEMDRVNKPNEALILLDVSYEINTLIRMLEEFQRANYATFGEWRLVP